MISCIAFASVFSSFDDCVLEERVVSCGGCFRFPVVVLVVVLVVVVVVVDGCSGTAGGFRFPAADADAVLLFCLPRPFCRGMLLLYSFCFLPKL